uniref:Lysine rich nucleolar protein 1 n=1 Tax=Molossus molossus TaxID=27622 RepID=A0A7J8J0W9_MOLMO|nr:lysine rich nucleolar protein 1 [Molossus molossus]
MITKTHKGDLGLSEKNKKKKKKKKKKKVMVKEPETQYSVLNSNNCFTEVCPTRAMSPAESVIRGQAPEVPLMKKKESKGAGGYREEEPDTDLEVVLEKKGNMDETHIDQMRRKALQEEIDRESGKTEASETWKWTGTQFGQWDTAGFENEEQKLKFLKLMGGFKNLSPSLSRTPDMVGRPSMALNKKAADALQRSLQQDYDRALRWKYSWGAGLGFPTAPRKAFYIDRNASKSVKFED